MRTSAIQFASGTDVGSNLEAIRRLISSQARSEPDLVVAPEASMHDFGPRDLPLGPVAQPVDGPFVSALSDLARSHRTCVVAGMFETSQDAARPYNTLVAVGSDGDLLASYRKIHLYDSFGYRESDRLLAGPAEPTLLGVGGHLVGLMTCYDLRFPWLAQLLVDAGADTLAVPAAWVRGPLKEDHWVTLARSRAIENTVYVVAAGQCGPTYIGTSMVVDPMGVVVAALGEEEGVVSADVDASRLASVRRRNPSIANRRDTVSPQRTAAGTRPDG